MGDLDLCTRSINDFNPLGDDVILDLQKAVLIKYAIEMNRWSDVFDIRRLVNIGMKAVGKGRTYGFKLNKLKRLLELEDNIKY